MRSNLPSLGVVLIFLCAPAIADVKRLPSAIAHEELQSKNRTGTLFFDGSRSTAWVSDRNNCEGRFVYRFSAPVHVKGIILDVGSVKGGETLSTPKEIELTAFPEEEPGDVAFGDVISVRLKDGQKQFVSTEGMMLASFLPVRNLTLQVNSCFGNKALAIREIVVEYGEAKHAPRLSVSELARRFRMNTRYWGGDAKAGSLLSPLADLIWYTLRGNAEAEALFRAYSPASEERGHPQLDVCK